MTYVTAVCISNRAVTHTRRMSRWCASSTARLRAYGAWHCVFEGKATPSPEDGRKSTTYSAGPVIRKQDFQIDRRFLKTDAFTPPKSAARRAGADGTNAVHFLREALLGGVWGRACPPPGKHRSQKKAGDFLFRKFLMSGPTLYTRSIQNRV